MLDIPLDKIENNYQEAIERIERVSRRESDAAIRIQADNYVFAKKSLHGSERVWGATYADPGGVWDQEFRPRLEGIAEEYNSRAEEGNQIVSDLLVETNTVIDKLAAIIRAYNIAAAVLEIPIISSIKGRPGGAPRIAIVATDLAVATSPDNIEATTIKDIRTYVKEGFSSGNNGVGGFDHVINAFAHHYQEAWDRMRLAVVNYENFAEGRIVHATSTELESSLSAGSASIITDEERNNLHTQSTPESSLIDDLREEFS